MKKRIGFVSNSSSSSFIVAIPKSISLKDIENIEDIITNLSSYDICEEDLIEEINPDAEEIPDDFVYNVIDRCQEVIDQLTRQGNDHNGASSCYQYDFGSFIDLVWQLCEKLDFSVCYNISSGGDGSNIITNVYNDKLKNIIRRNIK